MADLSLFEKAVSVLGVLGLGGVLTYFGNRYSANKSSEPAMANVEVAQRRATLEEIQFIVERHEIELERLKDELEESRTAHKTSRSLLRLALQHIGLLRRDMREAGIEPPALPEQLTSEQLPWDLNMYD
jgi:chromosome segregation ATPase